MSVSADRQKINNEKVNHLKARLKKVPWFISPDGETTTAFPGAKRGNRVYAYRQDERIQSVIKQLHMDDGDCLFLTFTFDPSGLTVPETWTKGNAEISKAMRKLKRLGIRSYVYVKEAHLSGRFHVHAVVKADHRLPFFTDHKGKCRLSDIVLRRKIQNAWTLGHVDVQGIKDEGAGHYLAKELGKVSHVENALSRYDKGTAEKSHIKKLLALYYLVKLNIRQYGVSADLIPYMNNSTDEDYEPSPVYMIPRWIVEDPRFQPYCQTLIPGTWLCDTITQWLRERQALSESVWKALAGARSVQMDSVLAGA